MKTDNDYLASPLGALAQVKLRLTQGAPELQPALRALTEQQVVRLQPDGSQPLELKRTKALSYSRLNLLGLMSLATLAERVGVDLWNYQAPGGGSIRKALDFLLPYIKTPPQKWPYPQLTPVSPADFIPLLRQAAVAYKEPSYEQVLSGIPASKSALVQLLHPRKETKRP